MCSVKFAEQSHKEYVYFDGGKLENENTNLSLMRANMQQQHIHQITRQYISLTKAVKSNVSVKRSLRGALFLFRDSYQRTIFFVKEKSIEKVNNNFFNVAFWIKIQLKV